MMTIADLIKAGQTAKMTPKQIAELKERLLAKEVEYKLSQKPIDLEVRYTL